jgi:hypothetical protein
MEDKNNVMPHKIHICDLADQEKNDEIKELARDPQFMCFSCGRVANEKVNLCDPLAFYELTGGVSFD